MDIIVRFWDTEKNKVLSRYLNSQFLGHTRAADLLQKFNEALGKLNLANLFQVSMDGPNMNWKFFDSLCEYRALTDPDVPHLINAGSCGTCSTWCLQVWGNWLETGQSFKITVLHVLRFSS